MELKAGIFVLSISSNSYCTRLDPNQRIGQENGQFPGFMRGFMKAIFLCGNFQVFSGGFQPFSNGKQRKRLGITRNNPENFKLEYYFYPVKNKRRIINA